MSNCCLFFYVKKLITSEIFQDLISGELYQKDSYDGLEGSSSREIFFYFWWNIFYFSWNVFYFSRNISYFSGNIFYFSGNAFISREMLFVSRDIFLFLAKRFSFSREIVFISRGTRGFGRLFRKYVDWTCSAPTHTDKEPVSLNTTAWKTCWNKQCKRR